MNQSILIIEDADVIVELYRGLLNPRDERIVDVAKTREEAMDYMRRNTYDLYIVDINLKGGEEGTDLVSKGGATPDKCIVMSGNLTEDKTLELISLYKLPRDHCMNKPPDKNAFLDLSEKILNTSKEVIDEPSTSDNLIKLEEDREIAENQIVNWQVITHMISQMSMKQWITIICAIFVFATAISTYSTYIGYRESKLFEQQFNKYCDNRFSEFRQGKEVTRRTYVEKEVAFDKMEVTVRFYPDNFVSVLLSTDDIFEPRHYWLSSPEYAKKLGLDKQKSFLDIISESWLNH